MIPPITFASFLPNAALALPTSFATAQSALIPLVLVALLLDALIVGIWYMFGYVLGNSAVRQSARSEFYQLIGTALLIGIITFALLTFGGFFKAALNNTALLNQNAVSSMSSNIISESSGSGSPIGILNGSGFSTLLDSVVNPNVQAPDPVTSQIDYPLAASGVVLENLTYQSVVNINRFFVVDSYIGFLKTLSPNVGICVDSIIEDLLQCITPAPEPPVAFFLSVSDAPYAGLAFVYSSMATLGILLTTALYSFIIQLSFITIFLFAWPWLIFVGLVLRSNFVTRKVGGLFIAVAIGVVFFFPVIFAIQYLALGNGLGALAFTSPASSSISAVYGYNSLPTSPLTALAGNSCVNTASGTTCNVYVPNFYVFPNVETVANSYGCWPPNGDSDGAFDAEAADIIYLWGSVVVANPFYLLYGSFVNGYPPLALPYQCAPQSASNLLFAYLNMYGVYGVTGYLLPLLDVLITIAAIVGLSSILGGDTTLAGLGRLV